MKGIKESIIFLIGAGIGFGASYMYWKRYFETLADEEIESVKKVYSVKREDSPVTKEKPPISSLVNKDEKVDYDKKVSDYSAYNRSFVVEQPEENPSKSYTDIYIISGQEFAENDEEYEISTLTYYGGDHTITDDKNIPIDNPEDIIGVDGTLYFEKNPDESIVYIRNDADEHLYELCYDGRSYKHDVKPTE